MQVSLEREISEFLFLLLEILQTLLLLMKMKRKRILNEVRVRGGKRRRLQREEGAIEDVGSRQDQTKLVVSRRIWRRYRRR